MKDANRLKHCFCESTCIHPWLFIAEFYFVLNSLTGKVGRDFSLCTRGSISIKHLSLSFSVSGQFLLEESRLLEAAEMAQKAAQLDSEEFDVVFSAAHMLR